MTPNTDSKIWLALRGKVESLVLGSPLPIIWPGTSTELPTSRCIEVFHLVNRPARLFVGSNAPHERRGILQMSLLTESNATSEHQETVIREIAGDIADHFPVDHHMTYGDVTVTVYELPEVAATFKDEKRNRVITPISVRWECHA